MRQSAVSFKTEGLTFEGVITQPDEGSGPWPGVVICHPHPLHGGSMDNNVVLALAMGLVEEGFVTLRFNFRGVGGSEGEHTEESGTSSTTLTPRVRKRSRKCWELSTCSRPGPTLTPTSD